MAPISPPTRCNGAGCTARTKSRYCDDCKREKNKAINKQRTADIGFYKSQQWQWLRTRILTRDPFCKALLDGRLCNRISTDVDHVIPRERGGSDNEDNLQGLCHSCHSRKTAHELKESGKWN